MSDYIRITDRKIELTNEGAEALMSDYTPTTEEVRRQYSFGVVNETFSSWGDAEKWFDSWLFEMQEDAWDRGYQAGVVDFAAEGTSNPYRQGEEQ